MWHSESGEKKSMSLSIYAVVILLLGIGAACYVKKVEAQEIKLVSPGLINEPGQANLGPTPHKIGIADGSSSSPVTDLSPTLTFQRWSSTSSFSSSSLPTSIPYQFYCNHLSGPGYIYCGDFWVRNNSSKLNDITGVSGRVYMEPFGLVQGVTLSPSSTGGSLSAGNVAYYVSGITSTGEEILGSQHATASLSGSTSSVTVSWSALAGASSYRVYRYYPDLPLISPVWFSAGSSTTFTDTGATGTAGIGLSSTGWGGWFQAWKATHSARIAGIEIDAMNISGMDAPYRPDVAGSSIGAQIVSAGGSKNSIGVHLVGEANSPFRRGILLDVGSFSELGIDIESTDNSNTVSLIRNSSSTGTNSAAVWRAQTDTATINLISHGSARTITRNGIALGGYSEVLQTAGNGLLISTLGTPIVLGTGASTPRISIGGAGKVTFSTPRVDTPKLVTITSDSIPSSIPSTILDGADSSLVFVSCDDPDTCLASITETGAASGQRLTIVNRGQYDLNMAASSGVLEMQTNWIGEQYTSLDLVYVVDRWVETGRSN